MGLGKMRKGVLLAGAVALILMIAVDVGVGCVIRRYIGIPCPGCGLTRAWFSALRLDFAAALRYHPMFWSVPVFFLFVLFDGRLLKCDRWNNLLLYGLVAAYVGCYVARLFSFLGGF